MVLVKCLECGEDVSDKAKICPNCGKSIKRVNKKIPVIISCFALLVVTIIVIMNFVIEDKNNTYVSEIEKDLGVKIESCEVYLDKDYTNEYGIAIVSYITDNNLSDRAMLFIENNKITKIGYESEFEALSSDDYYGIINCNWDTAVAFQFIANGGFDMIYKK